MDADATDQVVATAVVPEGVEVRVDRLATETFSLWLPSRSRARKACKAGRLRLDGAPVESSRFPRPGQILTLHADPREAPHPLRRRARVVHHDPELLIAEKPAGLLTTGPRPDSLERALVGVLPPSPRPDALAWPRPVHRLDRPTGGLVICARTASAQVWLGRAFQERRVHKRYRALVVGALAGPRRVDEPLDGRPARTRVVPVAWTRSLHVGICTTVDLFPETGRTHQLRRHCAALGHPILGDARYTPPGRVLRHNGIFLWALEIALAAPDGRRIEAHLDEPHKLRAWRARDVRRWIGAYPEGPSDPPGRGGSIP